MTSVSVKLLEWFPRFLISASKSNDYFQLDRMASKLACIELALEGERLCKGGEYRIGAEYLEAAIKASTDDLQTLSAIYSQLGNANFYLGEYNKAVECHKQDLALARKIGDKLGEAKASGNLGNTLKVIGKFDDAILYCRRHLDISNELDDKVGEARALYNLGNVYHAKGKHIGKLGNQEPSEFPEEVKRSLQQAVEYYTANLQLVTELGDRFAQGRSYGNLGNTYYLLGNFSLAVTYHKERLKIAKEFGDKAAERRAHTNLGNAYIFLGEFEMAADNYKRSLMLAQELNDRAVEAQACYSLGNTYALLGDYAVAIEYHMRHLRIAQELQDKIGEARAYWSLGNAHCALGDHDNAIHFAKLHLEIAQQIGDPTGQATAHSSLVDLTQVLGFQIKPDSYQDGIENIKQQLSNSLPSPLQYRKMNDVTAQPTAKFSSPIARADPCDMGVYDITDKETFFELISHFQSKRMDDQRCSLATMENKENENSGNSLIRNANANYECRSSSNDDFFDMIAGFQSKRLDEQRASLPCILGINSIPPPKSFSFASTKPNSLPDEGFFDLLMRCQGTRIEDQRSTLPVQEQSAPTMPDEDFFGLIMRLQSGRIDDQRSELNHRAGIANKNSSAQETTALAHSKLKTCSTSKSSRWLRYKR